MADSSLNQRYFGLFKKLFPRGFVWEAVHNPKSTLSKLLLALSVEFARIEERALALVRESLPTTSFELLPDWERVFRLPDECTSNQSLTIEQRRQRISQLLTTRGGQNKNFYKQLAANFGFDIGVIDVSDQPPFRAGQGRAGDRITNGTWRYAFVIQAPADSIIKFRAGKSSAGDRLLLVQNSVLQCLIDKYKPAHTVAIFSFKNS